MPFPIAAVIVSALGSYLASKQGGANAGAQAAAQANAGMGQSGTALDMSPTLNTAPSPGVSDAAQPKSAHGRTLATADTGFEDITSQMAPIEAPSSSLMQPIPDSDINTLGGQLPGGEVTSVYDQMQPISAPSSDSLQEIPVGQEQVAEQGGMFSDMTPEQMAMLGLAFGSEIFKPKPGPRPPSLPNAGGGVRMTPVFRG